MKEPKTTETTVVIPLALTDFAKALRELIGAFRDAAGLAGDGLAYIKRRKARERAIDLDYLGFEPNGFLRPLTRIAAGRRIPSDFDELDQLRGDTAEGVTQRVQALRGYRATIRENCGLAAAHRLDKILDGPAGKFLIRYEIDALVDRFRGGANREELISRATSILDLVGDFNQQLTELHDLMLPPRGAPK